MGGGQHDFPINEIPMLRMGPETKTGSAEASPRMVCNMNLMPKPDRAQPILPFIHEGAVKFTPEQAKLVFDLCRYDGNRNEDLGRQNILAMSRMMAAGQWRDRATIEFARLPDGTLTLTDGHHRMLSQSDAGVDIIWNIIIHDVEDQAAIRDLFWTYDTTLRKRTLSNVLNGVNAASNLGLTKGVATSLAKAVTFIDNGFRPTTGISGRTYTPAEQLSLMADWTTEAAKYSECIEASRKTLRRKLETVQIMASALVTYRSNQDLADMFWMAVAKDDGLSRGDPRKTLNDWLRDTHLAGSGLTSAAMAAARAWNAFVTDKQITFIRIGTQPIRFIGTSVVVAP